MILYIKEGTNETKLNVIKSAMELAQQEYPDVGYCFERAEYIRKFLGYGEVMTFSATGISYKHTEHIQTALMLVPEIQIPYDREVYNDCTTWKFHTVFVYNNNVFTYEIKDWHCSLANYRKKLNALNDFIVKANNEKQN